jgi:hypothetical protein
LHKHEQVVTVAHRGELPATYGRDQQATYTSLLALAWAALYLVTGRVLEVRCLFICI